MTQSRVPAGQAENAIWPPRHAAFDALDIQPRPGWAWEFLRRDTHYRAAALQNRQHWFATPAVDGKPSIYRVTAQDLTAEEWGLCTFR